MSYCRFSDDSHVYAYQTNETCYICHVSVNRPVPEKWNKFIERNEKGLIPPEDFLYEYADCYAHFDHPRAGEDKTFKSAQELLEYLKLLRDEGLKIPQYAFDRLESEL